MPYSPLDEAVRELVDDTLEHFNAHHADTVLLLARHAAGAAAAVEAEAVHVDTEGLEFDVAGDRGTQRARVAFAAPVATAEEVSTAVMTLIGAARAAAGDGYPLTSFERELGERGAIATHVAEVRRVTDLTGNLREVVVGGSGLADYVSAGGDQFLYVMVPRPGAVLPATYSMATWMADDPATRPFGAYYTARCWDPDATELTLWAVLHDRHHRDHHAGVGAWFGACRPGDRLAMWGPRAGFWSEGAYALHAEPRHHVSGHHLFVTDETGFCAVAAILDGLADADTATVIAETVDAGHAIGFPGSRTNVVWHYRGEAPPGTGTGLDELVADAVARLGHDAIATAFGAGESRQMTRIRKFLRREVGLPASKVSMTGYWRRATDGH